MWRLCVLCVLLSPVQAAGQEPSPKPTSANGSSSDVQNQTQGRAGKAAGQKMSPTPTSANANSNDVHNKTQESPVKAAGEDPSPKPTSANGNSNDVHNKTQESPVKDIYARPGTDVLLPVTYNLTRDVDTSLCDEFVWYWSQKGSTDGGRISRSKRCEKPEVNFQSFPNYNVSQDGRLTISKVTRNNSGNHTFIVYSSSGAVKHNHSSTLHVQDPVSQPLLNVSCLLDGGAVIVCSIDSGDDPRFSISVNGRSLLENSTLSRTVENVHEFHVPATSPGPWNITCSVSNRVSDSETGKSQVKCAVPVSAPVLVVGCLHDGSLAMSCSVENGSDPLFSLSVNGTYLLVNDTKEEKRVNVTTSSPGPWDVHCSVGNSLMWKKTNVTSLACPVPPSDPVLEFSCHNGTLMINCSVEKGSDVIFSLSVNGTLLAKNVTNGQRNINVTSSLSGPWDVHCSVGNSLEERNTSRTYLICPVSVGPSSSSCMICLKKSAIGGVVALVVTTSPLLIAAFYIGCNTRQDH